MDLEDIYMLVRTMERDATTLVEAFPRLHRSQRDHLLNQHLGHRITETERALRALRQECETNLFGDEVKRLAHLRTEAAEQRRETAKERPGCPNCGGQPQDFSGHGHPDAKPCCNTACKGEWGTGCYHCHHPSFYKPICPDCRGKLLKTPGCEHKQRCSNCGLKVL